MKFLNKIFKRIRQVLSINFIQFLIIKYSSQLFWKNKKKILFKNYNCITFKDIKLFRKSDSVYIFGSGYSFNLLSDKEKNLINKHDVITFNWGHFQEDFEPIIHLSRRVGDWNKATHDNNILNNKWQKKINEYFSVLEKNNLYKETILSIQWEAHARGSKYAVFEKLINSNRKILPYATDYKNICNLDDLDLLSHKSSTLVSAINLAAKSGWKNIILTCINLDQGYFWLNKNETTEIQISKSNKNKTHSSLNFGMKENLLKIKEILSDSKINLYRHENSTGLIGVLDVFPK